MTRFSVNLNKVALLRNSRNIGIPSVLRAAELSVGAGAHGITVHPRPDHRHVRPTDVYELSDFLRHYPQVEFNIEGNPCSGPQKLDSDFETVYSPERGRCPCKNIAHSNLSSRPA